MNYFIHAAFLVSAIAAVQLEEYELLANRHGLLAKEKNLDVDINLKKIDLHNHRHYKGRNHRFHKFRAFSHSNSHSNSLTDSHHHRRRHYLRRNRLHRFPRHNRLHKNAEILKVGDAQ